MHRIDTATERLTLTIDTNDDYGVPQELEYWTIKDFEDVLPSHQPTVTNDD